MLPLSLALCVAVTLWCGEGNSLMVQILGLIPAVLFGISAALSLNFEQGLILTGRHLMGKNKFIYWLGLCHEQNSKSCISFIVGFLNTPFPQKLKRSVWNAILYFKLNKSSYLQFLLTLFPPKLCFFWHSSRCLWQVLTGGPDCWWCLYRTTLGHSQAAEGRFCFIGSLGQKFR